MNAPRVDMDHPALVILLGLLSTLQLHLAKALQRQGIEVWDRPTPGESARPRDRKKPVIYIIGVTLNQLIFIYAVLAQPYGPPALFTSMFGVGLVFLVGYAAIILKEEITRRRATGAALIILGTVMIGVENIQRPPFDRTGMNLDVTFAILAGMAALAIAGLVFVHRRHNVTLTGVIVGAVAGWLGSLDPFLKSIGQNLGGTPQHIPATSLGMVIFVASFIIGFLAFVVTQWGFARKAAASLLVPVYNASYIGLPVALQAILLPGYQLSASTVAAVALLLLGVALTGAAGRKTVAQPG